MATEAKEWKSGVADEDWKVSICERDIRDAKRAVSLFEDVLGAPLEQFSGRQIRSAMDAYIASAQASIERGKAA